MHALAVVCVEREGSCAGLEHLPRKRLRPFSSSVDPQRDLAADRVSEVRRLAERPFSPGEETSTVYVFR